MKAPKSTKYVARGSLRGMVSRLAELGEQSAGEIGQEMWGGAQHGVPENIAATRFCRPAGRLLKQAEMLGWLVSREARNRKLWRVTPEGKRAVSANIAIRHGEDGIRQTRES